MNRDRASGQADSLSVSEGRFGFRQRAAKLELQRASSVPAFAAPAEEGAYGGGGGGYFGGNAGYYDVEQDKQVAAKQPPDRPQDVLPTRRAWVDSSVTDDDEKHVQKVERYSREYFDLIERHGKHVAQYLALDDPIVIKLDGTTYEW